MLDGRLGPVARAREQRLDSVGSVKVTGTTTSASKTRFGLGETLRAHPGLGRHRHCRCRYPLEQQQRAVDPPADRGDVHDKRCHQSSTSQTPTQHYKTAGTPPSWSGIAGRRAW